MQKSVNPAGRIVRRGVGLLRSIFAGNRVPIPRSQSALIEGLEPRVVLSSTGPMLTGVELMGPVSHVTSVVLTFSQPLDTATAENTQAYAFGKPPVPNSKDDSGFDLSDIFAFRYPGAEKAAAKKPKLVKFGKIQMSSAIYDSTNDTVTLTPFAPFKAQTYFRFLRIKGTGSNAIDDSFGNPLNNGKDTAARWRRHIGKSVSYRDDTTGSQVKLKLTGPGKLFVFTRKSKDTNPVIFVYGATAATALNGLVKNHNKILPTVQIAEIQGADGITNNLLNNPMFDVQATVP